MQEFLNKEKGITLIALVITIIILLILAGVSIAMLTGENGILTQAQRAKNETEEARVEEENRITDYEDYISQYTNGGYVESKGVNAPVLKDNMELVAYDEETGEWEENNSSLSYDYVEGTGTKDNNESKWANAVVTVDGVESYFVWIPRYAYKIKYNDVNDKSAGGTIDVKFLVGTSDNYYDENGVLQKAKRAVTGKEDTTSDYYVHPAFTNNVELGGWDSELTGIWVGKYETSLVDTSNKENITNVVTDDEGTGNILLSEVENREVAVQPGMSSWRWCNTGNQYTNARSYAENLNSHMLKNSEWGAVAYFTHSQYGRNGNEIGMNNKSYITAMGDIVENKNQSSTGNEYGIYDLNGGVNEKMSAYLLQGGENISYGNSLVNETNRKYVTVYTGSSTNSSYKLGDATYETSGWQGGYTDFINSENPFLNRGGACFDGESTGIFSVYCTQGLPASNYGFRICIITN